MKKVWKWITGKLGWIFGFIVGILTLKLFKRGGGLLPNIGGASDRVEEKQKERKELEVKHAEKQNQVDDVYDARRDAWRKRVLKRREEADRKARESANKDG